MFTPLTAISVGVIAVAALLAMQLLRPRPVKRIVATTQFWTPDPRSKDQRSLWGRFGRWGSFVAVLVCLMLLAAALSGWKRAADRGDHVFVIDAGYTMAASNNGRTRQADAIAGIDRQLASLGSTPTTVIEAGETLRVLDSVGRPATLLRDIVSGVRPTAKTPSTVAALTAAFDLLSPRGRIDWYTDRTSIPNGLPKNIVDRIDIHRVGTTAVNSAIVSIVFVSDPNEPARGTLRVGTRTWGSPRPNLAVRITDQSSTADSGRLGTVTDEGMAEFDSVLANGQTVDIALEGDATGVAGDDHAVFKLPNRKAIRFATAEPMVPPLRLALDTIGVMSGDGIADVWITADDNAAAAPAQHRATIRIVRNGRPAVAGTPITCDPSAALTKGLTLESAVCGSGPSINVPGTTPLLHAGEDVLAGWQGGERPTLWLSEALWTAPSTLPRRAAFVVFLARACRSLTNQDDVGKVTLALDGGDETLGDLQQVVGPAKPPSATMSANFSEPWELLLAIGAVAACAEGLLYAVRRIV